MLARVCQVLMSLCKKQDRKRKKKGKGKDGKGDPEAEELKKNQ